MQDGIGYLFTDIVGSVAKWESNHDAMAEAQARHNAVLEHAVRVNGGATEEWAGDGVFARFRGGNPLACALAIQVALRAEDWREVGGLAVRIGVHVGAERERGQVDQVAINRAARITAAAWGGQILVSAPAAATFEAPDHAIWTDLGPICLRGIDEPQHLLSLGSSNFPEVTFPPPRGALRQSPSLPVQAAPIFGRDHELAKLEAMFASGAPWVTLTGPGGIGKTRVALEFAARSVGPRETHFIKLATDVCAAPSLVRAIAGGLRLARGSNQEELTLIRDYLRGRDTVLIIDNCDGAVGAGDVLEAIVRDSPNTQLLTTSREPFRQPSEQVLRLKGLQTPSGPDWITAPAAMIFAQSARSAWNTFALAEEDQAALASICEAVRGAPLGLSLTAQWAGVMSLDEIAAKLTCGGAFWSSPRVAEERRLESAFEGSWALLDVDQQRALVGLSVFPSTFDFKAAAQIALVEPPVLQALERKSLVERADSHRFALHPLIVDFAAEKLRHWEERDRAALLSRYRDYYLGRWLRDFSLLLGPEQPQVSERALVEIENARKAWALAAAQSQDSALQQTAEALFYVYSLTGHFAEALLILSADTTGPSLPAVAAALRANCLLHLGRVDEAEAQAHESLRLACAEDVLARGHAHHALGNIAHVKGQWQRAESYYRRALALRLDDELGLFFSTISLAFMEVARGAPERAQPLIKQADRLVQRLGYLGGAMNVRACAGEIALASGDLEEARDCYRSALSLEASLAQGYPMLRLRLAGLLSAAGAHEEAQETLIEALKVARARGEERAVVHILTALGSAPSMCPTQARGYLAEALVCAVERLRTDPEVSRALAAVTRFEATRGEVRRAGQLAALAYTLKLEFPREHRDALAELGFDLSELPVVSTPESALAAWVAHYQSGLN